MSDFFRDKPASVSMIEWQFCAIELDWKSDLEDADQDMPCTCAPDRPEMLDNQTACQVWHNDDTGHDLIAVWRTDFTPYAHAMIFDDTAGALLWESRDCAKMWKPANTA